MQTQLFLFTIFSHILLPLPLYPTYRPGPGPGPLPERSGQGAGVGVGILKGYHNVSISRRFKNLVVPKYQDSTIHHQLSEKYRGLFKHILYLIGSTYVLTISGFQRFIKIPASCFPFLLKTIVNTNCVGPTKMQNEKYVQKPGVPHFPNL